METRSKAKLSGPRTRPQATSEGRTQLGLDNPVTSVDTLVNPYLSDTGSIRDGKSSFRTLPPEGGPPMPSNPFYRSESAVGACGSPEGGSSRRPGQFRECGDAGERLTPSFGPKIAAASSGKAIHPPDEEAPSDFTQNTQGPSHLTGNLNVELEKMLNV